MDWIGDSIWPRHKTIRPAKSLYQRTHTHTPTTTQTMTHFMGQAPVPKTVIDNKWHTRK